MNNSQVKVKLYDVASAPITSTPYMNSSSSISNHNNNSNNDLDKIDMILESPSHYSDHSPLYVNHRVLGTFGVTAITFLLASAGPLGSEPVIASAGPLVGMAGFILYPLFITIPFAFIIAELCSAFPEDGGFTVWVMNAFGPFWGFQVGYWSWMSGIFNGALLPGVLVQLATAYFSLGVMSPVGAYAIKATIALALTLPTLTGAQNVSRLCIALCIAIALAFLIFTVWAYTVAVDFDDLFEVRHEHNNYNSETKDAVYDGAVAIDWSTYVNTIFWNYDGLIMLSVFGGQVHNPARVYPRAIAFTVLLMMAMYIVPMPAGLCSDNIHWSMLENDAYPLLAKDVGGRPLQTLVVVAAMCSTAGMFIAGLYAKSFQLSGMAEHVLVPHALASRATRFDVPYNATLLTLALTLPLLSVEYNRLLPITNAFSAAVQFLVIATAYSLRVKLPYIPRPTRVPGGRWMLLLFALLPAAILSYILYHAFTIPITAFVTLLALLPGLAYGGWQSYRQRNATW